MLMCNKSFIDLALAKGIERVEGEGGQYSSIIEVWNAKNEHGDKSITQLEVSAVFWVRLINFDLQTERPPRHMGLGLANSWVIRFDKPKSSMLVL